MDTPIPPAMPGSRRCRAPIVARAAVLAGALTLSSPAPPTFASASPLLGTFGCPACHLDLASPTQIRSKAPSLRDAGARYRTAYLFDYLRSPRAVRRHLRGARMPDFRLAEGEALALALFLSEQKRGPALPELPEDVDRPLDASEQIRSDAEFRRVAGEKQSCLACHTQAGRGGVLGPELQVTGARLRPAWLRRFLAAPQAWGVSDGTMPALFLRPAPDGSLRPVDGDSVRDLRRIADYLSRTAATQRTRMQGALAAARRRHPEIGAPDGRRLFDALACRACHRFDETTEIEAAPPLRPERLRVREAWLRDYLARPRALRPFGTRPGSGARMPDFRLTPEEIDELVTALGPFPASEAEPARLTAYERRKVERLLERKLPCRGCHRLGAAGGRIGPDLNGAAQRLRPEFVERMIANPQATVPSTTMPRLPLDDPTRELLVAYLLEPGPAPESEGTYLSLLAYPTIDLPRTRGPARDYAIYCAPCHGAAGTGDGFNAPFLDATPTAHADPGVLRLRADDTLFDAVHAGGAILDRSHLMPPWGETLSPERIAGLVAYLRELCDCEGPYWSTGAPPAEDRRAQRRPAPPRASEAPAPDPTFEDFVGAEACRECHAPQYARWRASTHGRAGGRPGEVPVIGAFDGRSLRFRDAVVEPRRTPDGRFFFRVQPDDGPPREIDVAAVVGGGHLIGGGTQTYFAAMPDGTFRMLPFDFHRGLGVWFVQRRGDGKWIPAGPRVALSELEHWPPRRALGSAPHLVHCENCHGSQLLVDFDETTGRYRTRWKSLRIDCESCHGPGSAHVAWARSPDRDEDGEIGIDPLTALSKEESVRVCLRCHANKQVLSPDYLPGANLETHLALKLPMLAQRAYLVDGRIDGFGYQQNHLFSDCFVEGSMVCTDCHDPHTQSYRDVWRRPLDGRFDDGQCTACHPSKMRNPAEHTHHSAGSPGRRCVACHMPYLQHQAVGDEIPFARSDHTIPIPRPAFDESIGIENACAKCHAERSTAELQATVEKWWGPLKPHHPMVAATLSARSLDDAGSAARLLLVPSEIHTIAQMGGLAEFVRRFVRTDAPLPEDAEDRLATLVEEPDADVSAVAALALLVASPNHPKATDAVARARHDAALRLRLQYGLVDLSRLRARQGDRAEAGRVRLRLGRLSP